MPRTLQQYKNFDRISLFAVFNFVFNFTLNFIFTLVFALTFIVASSDSSFAADNRKTVYHGRIVKPDGTALSGTVAFTLQITDTSGSCVLWEETQNATVSSGVFSLTLGSGTNVFDGSGNSGTLFASPIFRQSVAINCKGGTPSASVTPGASDDRNLNVTFDDGTGVQTLSQQIPIKSVPYSLYATSAANADKMAGYAVSTTAPATGQVLTFNGTSWAPANAAATGVTSVTSANSDISVATSTTTPVLTLNSGTGANQIVKLNGSSQLPVVDGSQLTSLNASNLASGYVSIARGGTGLSTSGAANQVLGMNNAASGMEYKTITAGTGITVTHGAGSVTIAATNAGTVTSVTGTSPITIAGTAQAPVVGITAATISASGVVQLAQSTDTAANLVVQANDTRLTNARTPVGTTLTSGNLWVGNASNQAAAVSMSGDATLSSTGALTLANTAVTAGTYGNTTTIPTFTVDSKGRLTAAASAAIPTANGSTTGLLSSSDWTTFNNKGTVASVTSANSDISVSASTTAPVLTLNSGTGANQIVKLNGSSQLPAVDGSQLISLNASQLASGYVSIARGGTSASTSAAALTNLGAVAKAGDTMTGHLTFSATKGSAYTDSSTSGTVTLIGPNSAITSNFTLRLPTADGSANQVLKTDGAGNLGWATDGGGTVTNVTASAPLSVTNGTTTPNISIPYASSSTSGALGSGDWTTFNNKQSTTLATDKIWIGNASSVATAVSASKDVSVTYNAGTTSADYTVKGIRGIAVSATTPTTSGQVLRYDSVSTSWIPNFISMADLRSTITGASALTSCSASQTLTWSSATDNLACSNISISAATQVTGLLPIANGGTNASTSAAARTSLGAVNIAGDTMTGTLNLPANGLTVGTSQLVASGGNIGIGITAPATPLHVQGPTLAGADSNRNMMVISDRYNNGTNGGDLAVTSLTNAGSFAGWNLSSDWAGRLSFGVTTGAAYGTTPNEYLTIISGGNVGIGTTGPSADLDVSKTTSGGVVKLNVDNLSNTAGSSTAIIAHVAGATAAGPIFAAGIGGVGAWKWGVDSNSNAFKLAWDSVTSSPINIQGAASAMTVLQGGNVGIGTTSPGNKLDLVDTNQVGTGSNGNLFIETSDAAAADVGGMIGLGGVGSTNGSGGLSTAFATIAGRREGAAALAHWEGYLQFSTSNAGAVKQEHMRITSLGYVGIGNTSPGSLLHVGSSTVTAGSAVAQFQTATGTCTMTPATSGSGMACSSDERLKTDIDKVSGDFALEHILQLQAVTYKFKKDPSGDHHTGYIAQQIKKVAPEFVRQNDDGFLQVYYDGLIPWITEAIKELHTRLTGLLKASDNHSRDIASVKAENAALKQDNAELKAKAAKAEQENAEIKARLEKIEKALNSK